MKSNDTEKLIAINKFPYAKCVEYNFPGVYFGFANYMEGPTGCSVIYIPKGAMGAVDIRGGSPTTFGTDNYSLKSGSRMLHAICLSGGSIYGIESSLGVQAELYRIKSYERDWRDMPKVAGASIYDFIPRENAIYPDKELGIKAMRGLHEDKIPLGLVGAGISATVGLGKKEGNWEYGGQGSSFYDKSGLKILVLTIVNSIGYIFDKNGKKVRGIEPVHKNNDETGIGNTTLTIVITNKRLIPRELNQLSTQIHTSMSRAIHPFHTIDDGDALFMLSTNELEETTNLNQFGIIASDLVWDAVLNSI